MVEGRCQSDSLQRYRRNSGITEQPEDPGRLPAKSLGSDCIKAEYPGQLGPDGVGETGKTKCLKILIDDGTNVVFPGVRQKPRPAHRGGQ